MVFLSVVIPVYNEQESIERVIKEHVEVLELLKGKVDSWEIVCLNDASTDLSPQILQEYAARERRLRVLSNPVNQGISFSFNRLYQEARGDYIYLTAGDGQWPASNLPVLVNACIQKNADLVVGVRQGRQRVYGLGRQLLSYGFNGLAKILLKVDARDVNGIKLGRRRIFQVQLKSKSFFAEIERIALAQKKGATIIWVPVEFLSRQYGRAQGARVSNVAATIRDLIRFLIQG